MTNEGGKHFDNDISEAFALTVTAKQFTHFYKTEGRITSTRDAFGLASVSGGGTETHMYDTGGFGILIRNKEAVSRSYAVQFVVYKPAADKVIDYVKEFSTPVIKPEHAYEIDFDMYESAQDTQTDRAFLQAIHVIGTDGKVAARHEPNLKLISEAKRNQPETGKGIKLGKERVDAKFEQADKYGVGFFTVLGFVVLGLIPAAFIAHERGFDWALGSFVAICLLYAIFQNRRRVFKTLAISYLIAWPLGFQAASIYSQAVELPKFYDKVLASAPKSKWVDYVESRPTKELVTLIAEDCKKTGKTKFIHLDNARMTDAFPPPEGVISKTFLQCLRVEKADNKNFLCNCPAELEPEIKKRILDAQTSGTKFLEDFKRKNRSTIEFRLEKIEGEHRALAAIALWPAIAFLFLVLLRFKDALGGKAKVKQ